MASCNQVRCQETIDMLSTVAFRSGDGKEREENDQLLGVRAKTDTKASASAKPRTQDHHLFIRR